PPRHRKWDEIRKLRNKASLEAPVTPYALEGHHCINFDKCIGAQKASSNLIVLSGVTASLQGIQSDAALLRLKNNKVYASSVEVCISAGVAEQQQASNWGPPH
ncbi:MAG: hypothetical protein KDK33_13955, partial [Leptospiraceae bacterium]|nr:hypothetical protein [Leptospiraceae bacterium]